MINPELLLINLLLYLGYPGPSWPALCSVFSLDLHLASYASLTSNLLRHGVSLLLHIIPSMVELLLLLLLISSPAS